MNVKVKSLKVYSSFDDNPIILLKGKWLRKLNFNIRDEIIITKKKEPKNNF